MYKVVAAMAPLYFALGLGYGSVRWWRLFTADQCDAVNRLVACFAVPFFAFDFAARIDPFALSYRVLAADALSKLAVALALAACAAAASTRCCGSGGGKRGGGGGGGGFSWCITGFSLATLNNTLVVGVPLLDAMYGRWAQDLVVQIAVVQSMVWFPLLLMAFELRKAWVVGGGGGVGPAVMSSSSPPEKQSDVEMNGAVVAAPGGGGGVRLPFWATARTVGLKLARNPNVYASVLGVVWACIAYRYIRVSHALHAPSPSP